MNEPSGSFAGHYFLSDENFNELYPPWVRTHTRRHWTPLHVVKQVLAFLAARDSKILDIGSGVGKFCLTAAYYAPNVNFYGVEQRENLVSLSIKAQRKLGIGNVSFIKGNFTQLDLRQFNHFYFYNAFYENLDQSDRIDGKVDCSEAHYEHYVQSLYTALQLMPEGTRIATYHSFNEEIPPEYTRTQTLEKGDLNFWIKK